MRSGVDGSRFSYAGIERVDILDEFNGGSLATGDIGDQGWQFSGSGTPTMAAMTPEAEHVGGRRVGTGATTSSTTNFFLGPAIGSGIILASDLDYFSYVVRLQSLTSETWRLGMGTNALSTATELIMLAFDPAVHATNFQTVSKTAGGTETTTTSIAAALDTWYFFECWRTAAGTLSFSLNRTALVAHTVRVPSTSLLLPQMQLITNENVLKTVSIDRFRMRSIAFANRWA